MSTEAQVRANIENAQHSTGPKTESGKAASSMNNLRHGMTSAFRVLPSEDRDEFDRLAATLHAEHRPSTITEAMLVEKMAQHYWLSQRALSLQDQCCTDRAHRAFDARCAQSNEELSLDEQRRQLALFLRYQTTNDRAFHKCLNDLLKLKAEKRRSEIGFESQQHKKAQESRREAAEKRKQDRHTLDMLLAEAKVTHQQILNLNLEMDAHDSALVKNHPAQVKKAA